MDTALQVWGGGSYLLNKILFALAEGKKQDIKRKLKLYAWVIYIVGVPAWVVILLSEQNWIAASIEAGGVPSMCLGLYTVYQYSKAPGSILDKVASFFTYGSIFLGVGYSLVDYGGITSFSQVLEMGVMLGFLLGSYLLAKNNRIGWLFFMLMNASMAILMLTQQKPLLTAQQIISLGFVIYGFRASRKTNPL
ncbi:hypothetical protein UWK_00279 [Desulfocapsa sulfexigens DSM 10523]|uniref:Nicotinamide riboside transporter PnuC n=1 Tax=Desulfocapsa sulfexigens (strain DSM 10523 / SB164P1) TaxID=1167006 RepID=M1NAJ1_DESSD|nr:hypothetical protein [Desulfocapsa sulfexigens]AGF76864.1 hypothetical protein UWK_00279 [Desulfocapsa sulfexigens DSM 10523]